MSDDLVALKAKARLKHNNRGRCYPRRRCFECREVYPCLTIRLLDESDRLVGENKIIKQAIENLDLKLKQQDGPDGFIELYILQTGHWHRFLGVARGGGIEALAALSGMRQ